MTAYKDENGKILYPIRNWKKVRKELNKVHAQVANAQTSILCTPGNIDKEAYMSLFERQRRIEDALEIFDRPFINGAFYAAEEEILLINSLI